MDSDSVYTTNQPDIVKHAKYCCENYLTIVNIVPKDSNIYNYDMHDFALVDNKLAAAQLAIGESSNLAQLCLTYTYNYPEEKKFSDYVCILSVLAQIAIDNAKRKFDIDLNQEIARIKKDIDVPSHGLPKFWLVTKRDTRRVHSDAQRRERDRRNKEQIRKRIKEELQCPMNFLYELNLKKFRSNKSTLPMSYFWIKHELTESRRVSKRVEGLIQKYSLELHNFNMDNELTDEYLLIKSDFEDLVKEIRGMYISKNYKGLVSWLLNRAFFVGKGVQKNKDEINSTLSKNKSLLMKVLYDVNPSVFLECFKKS